MTTGSIVKTQTEARQRIEKDASDFLAENQHDLGVFFRTWSIYKNLPLERFKDAAPQKDRMMVSGTLPSEDLANIIIQTMAGVWLHLLPNPDRYTGRKLSKLVHREAEQSGAPRSLVHQLVDFFTTRYAA